MAKNPMEQPPPDKPDPNWNTEDYKSWLHNVNSQEAGKPEAAPVLSSAQKAEIEQNIANSEAAEMAEAREDLEKHFNPKPGVSEAIESAAKESEAWRVAKREQDETTMGINLGPDKNDRGISLNAADIKEREAANAAQRDTKALEHNLRKTERDEERAQKIAEEKVIRERRAQANRGLNEDVDKIVSAREQEKAGKIKIRRAADIIENRSVSNMGINLNPEAETPGIDLEELEKQKQAEAEKAGKEAENNEFLAGIGQGMATSSAEKIKMDAEIRAGASVIHQEIQAEEAQKEAAKKVESPEAAKPETKVPEVPKKAETKEATWRKLEDVWKELGKDSAAERNAINAEIEKQWEISIIAMYGSKEKYNEWQKKEAARISLYRETESELNRRKVSAESLTKAQREVFQRTADNNGKDGIVLSMEAFCGLSQQGYDPEGIRPAGAWECIKHSVGRLAVWDFLKGAITEGGWIAIPFTDVDGQKGSEMITLKKAKELALKSEADFKNFASKKEGAVYAELSEKNKKETIEQSIEQSVLNGKLKEAEDALAKHRQDQEEQKKIEAAEKIPVKERLDMLMDIKKKWDEARKLDKQIKEFDAANVGKFTKPESGQPVEKTKEELENDKRKARKGQLSKEIIDIAEKLAGPLRDKADEDSGYDSKAVNDPEKEQKKRLRNIALTNDVIDIFKKQIEQLRNPESAPEGQTWQEQLRAKTTLTPEQLKKLKEIQKSKSTLLSKEPANTQEEPALDDLEWIRAAGRGLERRAVRPQGERNYSPLEAVGTPEPIGIKGRRAAEKERLRKKEKQKKPTKKKPLPKRKKGKRKKALVS
ncbi:MAG: hypothetical protein NT026_01090 [Candidatus Staskawiczbacteria bacterium]|nr:hypothetical protein [Candidatus Staskawiczbacteria bacterium]